MNHIITQIPSSLQPGDFCTLVQLVIGLLKKPGVKVTAYGPAWSQPTSPK